jgi:hypothetical protein
MCNFNKQTQETKEFIHLFMLHASKNVGGVNFLLALIEMMKSNKPNALLNKKCFIESKDVTIKWEKVIFKDKFEVLESILVLHKSSQSQDLNILDVPNEKQKKKILNMVKTLSPIEFIITPKDAKNGNGFNFKVFESIEDNNVKINPIFVAMFFCSVEYTKKAIKFEER